MKKFLIYFGSGLVLIISLIGIAWLGSSETPAVPISTNTSNSVLNVDTEYYNFGTISMDAGNVNHTFRMTNRGTVPVTITKMFTSCMCTRATLKTADGTVGPYGMPGHGSIPRIDKIILPGETADINVVFDPAAHGPAGIGPIQRAVILENDAGRSIEVTFKALVTP